MDAGECRGQSASAFDDRIWNKGQGVTGHVPSMHQRREPSVYLPHAPPSFPLPPALLCPLSLPHLTSQHILLDMATRGRGRGVSTNPRGESPIAALMVVAHVLPVGASLVGRRGRGGGPVAVPLHGPASANGKTGRPVNISPHVTTVGVKVSALLSTSPPPLALPSATDVSRASTDR